MGRFPSGQRGQTVNLLAPPSKVRILLCPVYNQLLAGYECRCGGTGRRAGLKILLWQHSTGSIPVTGMFKFFKALGVPDFSGMAFFVFFYAIEIPLEFLLYKKVPLNRRTCGKGKTVAQQACARCEKIIVANGYVLGAKNGQCKILVGKK